MINIWVLLCIDWLAIMIFNEIGSQWNYVKGQNLTCEWDGYAAATKQLYEWFSPSLPLSVRPSVCLSVCLSVRLSHLFHYVPITVSSWNSHELLPMTKVRSMQKVKVRGRRSGSQVKNQLSCFQTVTPVWIHIWQWDDAQSLMLLRRGALLFFKVIFQISRSHGTTNRQFSPELSLSGLQLQFDSLMAMKWCTKLEAA